MRSNFQRIPGFIILLNRGYKRLLRLYPASFQKEYGAEMAGVFADLADEAASQGMSSLACLAAREAMHATTAITRAYWAQRGTLVHQVWTALVDLIRGLFKPGDDPVQDGRTSWKQSALETAPFALVGSMLVLHTYLPLERLPAAWQGLLLVLNGFVFAACLLWLLSGLAHGMPRWAFPIFGGALGYCTYAQPAVQPGTILAYLLGAAAVLVGLEILFGPQKPLLLAAIQRFFHRLRADALLLSFGLYGVTPLAIIQAFDNGYDNARTPWMLVSAAAMVIAAFAYSRCRQPVLQAVLLVVGVTLSIYPAVLDHQSFTGLIWLYYRLYLIQWGRLVCLLLAFPVGMWLYRIMTRRKAYPLPAA
jgi:hypothetical protein